jgi:cytochrome c553
MKLRPRSTVFFTTALLALAAAAPVLAEGGGQRMPAHVPAAYTQECGACHMAYPPSLLPAGSWQRLMTGLDKHFGSDASLDPALQQQIGGWLQAHAGNDRRGREEPPQDRITRSEWFQRKHREVGPTLWKLASVKSAANCGACHGGAERGNFDERQLRMPAGMDTRQRRGWDD